MCQMLSLDLKIGETRNDLLEEIKHKDLMSQKHIKTCKYLNYAVNQINYGLIKEENFTINLCKNG